MPPPPLAQWPQPGSGRPKGKLNAATLEIREIARAITLGNPKVVARLTREAESGSINPSVLVSQIDRGWGRPIPMEPEVSTRQSLVFISKPAERGREATPGSRKSFATSS